MKSLIEQFSRLWGQFGAPQRITLGLGIVGVVVAMTALVMWSRQPDFKLLYGRLGEKDAADVVAALEAQGIKYQIGGGGNSIYVPADKVYRVRMDLAAKGVPGGEGVGFEIFDRSNFGISDFVQRTNYARALQGELSRTISQLNGISGARVMIVMPENRLLLKTPDSRPTASVFVETSSAGLTPEAVNSIRSLVANSVEGLHLDDVAVVDNHGNVLSDQLKSDPMLGTASSQIKYRKQVEDYLGGKVETMLASVLGTGNAVVRVSAEIDSSAVTSVTEKFDPESQVARTQTSTEDSSLTTEKSADSGTAGVSSNVPNGTTTSSSPQKSSDETRKNTSQTYEINRVTTNTEQSPGTIKRLSAAVFIAQKPKVSEKDAAAPARTPEELDAIRQMVVNALGVQATTTEELAKIVSIQEVAFQQTAPVETVMPERIMSYVEIAKPLLTVLLAGGIFLFFLRMLKRSKAEGNNFELIPGDDQKLLTAGAENGKSRAAISPEMLNDLIRQKPDNVAAALRGWLGEKEQKGA
jgi:flagellar M-ring protein FliF